MMDEQQMKKFLAGLCLTGLLTGAGLTPANAQQGGQSGWSGQKPGAVRAPQTGWSGSTPGTVRTPQEQQKLDEEKAQQQKSQEEKSKEQKTPEQKPGQSGWSGTKR
jgi:radical SAM modification target selenobiotic family peptide